MSVRTFDSAKQLINFAAIPLRSLAPDSFITVEFNEDAYTEKVGAGGEVTREVNNNRTVKVTVVLMAASQDNDALSAIHTADRLFGTGIAPFFMKELNGTTVVASPESWIRKMPNVERGKESGTVTWEFTLADAEVFVGGLLT